MRRTFAVVEWGCRLLLAFVLLYGGLPKLFDLATFAETVGAYGLVPDSMVLPVAMMVALLEVIAGLGLLARKKMALHLTAALFFVFIGVLVYGIWLGLDIDCGCFSIGESESGGSSTLKEALVRDLILLLPLGVLYSQSIINFRKMKEFNREHV